MKRGVTETDLTFFTGAILLESGAASRLRALGPSRLAPMLLLCVHCGALYCSEVKRLKVSPARSGGLQDDPAPARGKPRLETRAGNHAQRLTSKQRIERENVPQCMSKLRAENEKDLIKLKHTHIGYRKNRDCAIHAYTINYTSLTLGPNSLQSRPYSTVIMCYAHPSISALPQQARARSSPPASLRASRPGAWS